MPPEHDPCLIEPRRGRNEESLPPSAILVFSPEDLRSFLSCFTNPVKKSHRLNLSEIYCGSFEGTPIAVAGPMLGAPQTILVLERMIALGVRNIIAAGWCGSLLETVRIGEIVLPSAAISEEGTSRHYPAIAEEKSMNPAVSEDRTSKDYSTGVEVGAPELRDPVSPAPSPLLSTSLLESLHEAGLTVHRGTIWTTDAPFRETLSKVLKFQSEGILAVDMETSALFTVARFRGVELAVVLVVSDDLSSLKWVHGFRNPLFKAAREKVVRSTLKAICSAAATLSAK
ncbi:MAG: nucleoside phosphorylase [Syntrophobacteraceae bacterium]